MRSKRAENVFHASMVDTFRAAGNPPPLGRGGGQLEGYIRAMLDDYFSQLGITCLQMTPLAYQGPDQRVWNPASKRYDYLAHGYGTWNHLESDPIWGSLEEFRCTANEQGLSVVYDLVHHTRSRQAPVFQMNPSWIAEGVYADPTWDLHALDLNNPDVRAYFVRYVRQWVVNTHDAGRLDSCHEMLQHFESYPLILQELDDLFLIGEVLEGDVTKFNFLLNKGLPAATNYPLYYLLTEQFSYSGTIENMEKVANTLFHMYVELGLKPWQLINFVENHDMVLYRQICLSKGASSVEADERFKVAYALAFLLPGMPSVYYTSPKGYIGTNFGDENRSGRPLLEWDDWGEFFPWLSMLSSVRKSRHALIYGEYREVWRPSWTHPSPVLAFARKWNDETVIVLVNNGNETATICIPISFLGIGDTNENELVELLVQRHDCFVQDGILKGTIPARKVLALTCP
jgi:glycosidase